MSVCVAFAFGCVDMSWKTPQKKKRVASAHTHTLTHTRIYKYSSTIFVKAGDKHRVFPHRLWLPFLSTEWKLRGSLKKECEREKIIDLSVTVCLCHEKPADHIALAEMVQRTQTLRHGINSMWKVSVQLRHSPEKGKTETNKPQKNERRRKAGWFSLPGENEARERRRKERRLNEGGRETSLKMTVWSLSVLAVQSLPLQIKGREVAWLSAALSHVKPRRRPYTCSHK